METPTFNNQEVEVTSVFFSHNDNEVRFANYPRRLVYKGREYILAEV
jgi:hypothetical protein